MGDLPLITKAQDDIYHVGKGDQQTALLAPLASSRGGRGQEVSEPALDSDLQDLYNEQLLALAGEDPLSGRLAAPQASVKLTSPLCGSRITVDLGLSGGKVADYGQVVRACTLGRASATVMARNVLGRTPQELRKQRDALQAVLKRGEKPPPEAWPEIQLFLPAKDFKSRHGSVMLAFDAVVKALDEIEGAGGAET